MSLSDRKIKFLEQTAYQIRRSIIEMLVAAGSGHTAGPLGMADVFTALYFAVLKHNPKKPNWPGRDYVVLSNGHICPVFYATLAHAGYFPVRELTTLRRLGSRLQGHPHRGSLPGIETTSGPLGSGLSQAVGIALGLRMDHKKNQVYCLLSDGEHDAGNTWEAALLAGKLRLDNLTAIIDRNNIQIDGMTEDVLPLESLKQKYEAFRWHVLEINGHSMADIVNACETARAVYEKPVVIIARTIPGKGVPEIEFDYRWHGKPPAPDEAHRFLAELRTLGGKVRSEHE